MILRKEAVIYCSFLLHMDILILSLVGVNFAFSTVEVSRDLMRYDEDRELSAPSVIDMQSGSGPAPPPNSRLPVSAPPSPPPPLTPPPPPGSKSLMEKAHDLFVTMMYKSEIPGLPGKDYPIMADIPTSTRFRCRDHYNLGYYADVDFGCQVIHVCQADGSHESFLCPNGTIFNQQYFVCDWWFNVDCDQSPTYYKLNGGIGKVAEVKSDVGGSVDAGNIGEENNDGGGGGGGDEESAQPSLPVEGVSEKDYFQESRIVEVVKH